DAHREATRCALAQTRLARQVAEGEHVRAPEQVELFHQVGQGASAKVRLADVVILLEPGERRLVAPRKPQRAIGKYALGVVDMADNFLDAPFLGPRAKICLLG